MRFAKYVGPQCQSLTQVMAQMRTKGKSSENNLDEFINFVASVIDRQDFRGDSRQQWLNFVTRKTMPEDPSVFRYSQASPGTRDDSDLAIISRAALLLRFASGSASQLIRAAGLTTEAINFWWEVLGQGRGALGGRKTAQ